MARYVQFGDCDQVQFTVILIIAPQATVVSNSKGRLTKDEGQGFSDSPTKEGLTLRYLPLDRVIIVPLYFTNRSVVHGKIYLPIAS